VLCARCSEVAAGPRIGPIARSQLTALVAGELPPALTHSRQHLALVSDFVTFHVASKPLKSFRALGGLLPDDAVPAEL
jgi:hypothetical protein